MSPNNNTNTNDKLQSSSSQSEQKPISAVPAILAPNSSVVDDVRTGGDGDGKTRSALRRRAGLIQIISLALCGLTLLSSSLSTLQLISNFNSNSIVYLMTGLLSFGVFFASYVLTRQKSVTTRRADVATYIILSVVIVAEAIFQFLPKTDGSVTAGFIIIPIIATLFGLNRRQTTVIAVLAGMVLTVTFSIPKLSLFDNTIAANSWELVSSVYVVPLVTWIITYAAAAVCIVLFTSKLDTALTQEEAQTERLNALLLTLQNTTEFGASLSRELVSITSELSATSRQQESGSQEQVAAVTQLTSSMEELGETANQIALSARGASDTANKTVGIAAEVGMVGKTTQQIAQEGTEAVSKAVASVTTVRNRIELMGQRLLNLTEQTRRVGSIIDLIDEIADETHLLALNASIEAAGSIMGGSEEENMGRSSSNRGERFGVIAQEIKGLADRSRESTEEVRQAITEMQGAVAAAVLVAEEGKKATSDALLRSQVAGAVIQRLDSVITDQAGQFREVLVASEMVKLRCDEISLATGQQRSANIQIVQTMRNVGDVAHQSAGAVAQIFETVSRITERVHELNSVLNDARFVTARTSDITGRSGGDKTNSGGGSGGAALSFQPLTA